MNPKIIFEDQHILVCLKPPKFPVQSDKTGDHDMQSFLYEYLKNEKGIEEPYIGLVHRIDRPVGGLVVFAKNPRTAAHLSKQLQNRTFKKTYFAVVEGQPEDGTLIDYVKKRFKDNTSRVVNEEEPKAKKAILHFETQQSILEDDVLLSLLTIGLETGRHHQIRVQLANSGNPLWGDTKYNPNFQEKKGWHQIALFAYKIEFIHPFTKKSVSFEANPTDYPFNLFK